MATRSGGGCGLIAMPNVIKATDRNRGRQAAAFNFEDLAGHADAYLDKVRQQAAQILAQAAHDAQAIREAAEAQGRLDAEQSAGRLLDERVGRQLETLLPALGAAVDEIHRSRHDWLADWEKRALHLALAIAGRVIRREVEHRPEVTLDLVRESLQAAAGCASLRLLLNPADHAALGTQVEKLAGEVSRLAPVQVVADPAISLGGCRLETQHGAIDQQFQVQLARIEEELT